LTLAAAHPDQIKQITSRHSIGGGIDLTLMMSLAGFSISAIKDVILAHLNAGRYKSVASKTWTRRQNRGQGARGELGESHYAETLRRHRTVPRHRLNGAWQSSFE
jgi:hypothetical protein